VIQNNYFRNIKMKFTEEKLEKAFVELLENEDYPHSNGDSIKRAVDEVLIKNEMKKK